MQSRTSWASIAALLLAGAFVIAALQTISYPLGTLGDEFAKIKAVRSGDLGFFHPLLMIEVTKAANVVARAPDPKSTAELGRAAAVVAGGLLVFATFLLARLVLPDIAALAAAIATAATPLVTTHARLFKEDIFLAPLLVLGLATLIKLLQDPEPFCVVLLGILAGLAAGAKYVGALFLPFALAAILLAPGAPPERRRQSALTVAGIAVLVFALIEIPAFLRLPQLQSDFLYELRHVVKGHDVALPVTHTLGVFHLGESLLPGLGLALLVLGVLGLAAPLLAPPERRLPLALIAAFVLLWYAVHELAPLKPYPDVSRYMLPLAPLLVVLATSLLYALLAKRDPKGVAAALVILAAALPALWMSVRINAGGEDPRIIVPQLVGKTGLDVVIDRYADYRPGRLLLGHPTRRSAAEKADLVVTANLTYDRFNNYAARKESDPRLLAEFYDELERHPYLEISNGRPTYAYFNPVLRIVAMNGKAERLKEIAAAIAKAAPDFTMRLSEEGGAGSN